MVKVCEAESRISARGAAYAPWHHGRCERHGGLWTAWDQAPKEMYVTNRDEVKMLTDQITCQNNRLSRVEGRSPTQHVFGYDVKIPMKVLSMRSEEDLPEAIGSDLMDEDLA